MPKQKTKGDRRPPAAAPVAPKPPAGVKPWHYALALAGAFIALLLAYEPALRAPFVFDDLYLPFTFQEFATASLRRWIGGVRPLLMLSFWLNHSLSEMEPFSYHLTNVLLHLGTALCSFLIVRKLLARAGENGPMRDVLAGFAAGVFLLHPLQTESVSYVASRSEVLSVFFFYAAFALFLYRRRDAISWVEAIGVLVLFAAAASTKEHTVVLPALLLLTDYYWNPGFSFRGIVRNWKLYVLVVAGAAVAARMVWRVLQHADSAGFSVKDFTWYQYFYTQCRAIWFYIRLFLLPFGQNLDHDFRPSLTVFDRGAVIGLAALVAVVAAALWYRKRFPLASYGTLVFLLLLAPTSSVVPIQDPVAERRMYLPMIGLLLVVAGLVRRSSISRARLGTALAGVLVILGFLTFARNQVWSSSVALWEDSVAKAPDKQRPQFQLAFAYYEQGRCDAALPHYAAAARNAPPDYRILTDWAIAYDCVGNQPAALDKLRQAEKFSQDAQLYSLFAMAYIHQANWKDALDALDRAEKINPQFANTYVFRASIYVNRGDLKAAEQEYRRALSVDPGNEQALQGLASVEQRLATGR